MRAGSRRARAAVAGAGLVLALAWGCADEEQGAPGAGGPPADAPAGGAWFEERAAASGLAFRHVSGHAQRYLMPEIMGGGAALLDLEGDGDLDVYLVQGGSLEAGPDPKVANRLFENLGGLRFRDVSEGSGAAHPGYGMGAACGDVDGDGDTDLFVTNVGPDALLRNDTPRAGGSSGGGAARFTETTAQDGTGDPGWGASAAFLDADRDGDLDLYVTRYLEWSLETEMACKNKFGVVDYCDPQEYDRPALDLFYRNDGSGGLADVSATSGVASKPGTGLGVGVGDLDDDGWPDVFVANDGMADFLWRNRGDGRFEDVAPLVGCAVDENGLAKAGMGVGVADVEDDGDLDVLVCNLSRESDSLFVNRGGRFDDRTARAGLSTASKPFTRFGLGLVDFDDDGVLDLYEANGRVNQIATRFADDPYAEPDLLLRGVAGEDGLPRFEEVLPRGGTAEPIYATSRAAAFGDLDDDGGVDVVVVDRDGPARLLANRVAGRGGWVLLRVLEVSGADALGARVALDVGGRTLHRQVNPGYSYLASNDPRVHAGLGAASRVDSVLVRWLDGTGERFGPLPAGRVHTLRRGAGRPVDGAGSGGDPRTQGGD